MTTPTTPMAVHFSSASAEWYTPLEIIERVLQTLGEIDLDPCAEAQRSIPARAHFTSADDGLSRRWHGRVYMNPPYGRAIGAWVRRLLDDYDAGRISSAIALVPARPGSEWWQRIAVHPFCLVHGRLRFSGHENSAPFPSAVFYLGGDVRSFVRAFGDLGDVFGRLEPC